ncbi:MAG: class I SAM-dependent methyltransferase [Thermoplasmata archaeon]
MERPELFLPFLEKFKERAEEEVEALDAVIRERGVVTGGRVLDLACGIARHSIPLAKRGYSVTGVDLSPAFIESAREYARAEDVAESTAFLVGDMRQIASVLEGQDPFDTIINMWTAMGYYGEEVDREVLRHLARFAADGGLLLVEMANKDGIARVFQERGWEAAGDLIQLERRRFDSERSHMVDEWTFYRREGNELTFLAGGVIDHRMYAPEELSALAESAGWVVEGVYAGLKLEPIEPASPGTRMFLVARKSETREEG